MEKVGGWSHHRESHVGWKQRLEVVEGMQFDRGYPFLRYV